MKVIGKGFQIRCWSWIKLAFSSNPEALKNAQSVQERARRFIEESIELGQAAGLPKEDIDIISSYVYSRPVGEPYQEMGGTLVTLASLAEAMNIQMGQAGWDEIERCYEPAVMEKIQKKQVSKQLHGIGGSPL